MKTQFFGSIMGGLAVSAALFLPLLVWQYYRYGRFDGVRMLWIAAGFIYAAALVAFTVFPLPEFTPSYCAAHATGPILDPLRVPRAMSELIRMEGLRAALTSSVLREFLLNIALFVPFGLMVRRLWEWPRRAVLATALGVSLLIELTQLTGNWGLVPCPYRFADVTDLLTNTAGAAIGLGLENITPRLLSTKAYLLSQRDRARPVTRRRRLFGMLLDAWYLALTALVGGTAAATLYSFGQGWPLEITLQQQRDLLAAICLGAWLSAMIAVVVPALSGNGASLGQRTVHLVPIPKDGSLWRRLARALVVQGAVLTGLYLGSPTAFLTLLLAFAAVASVLIQPRGLSFALSGCDLRDARTLE